MKKILLIMLAIITIMGLVACSGTKDNSGKKSGNLEGSLEEIIEKIYETADLEDDFRDYVENGMIPEEVNAERAEYFLGNQTLNLRKP